jgi:hypothetical protein
VNSPLHQQILRRGNPDFTNYPHPARLQNQLSFQKDYFLFARHPLEMASVYGASAFTQGIRQAASQRAGRGYGNADLSGAT